MRTPRNMVDFCNVWLEFIMLEDDHKLTMGEKPKEIGDMYSKGGKDVYVVKMPKHQNRSASRPQLKGMAHSGKGFITKSIQNWDDLSIID